METRGIRIKMNGSELALLCSALFAGHLWPFENPLAREALEGAGGSHADMKRARESIEIVATKVSDFARAVWQKKCDEVPGVMWTRSTIAKRARIRVELLLDPFGIRRSMASLLLCYVEFIERWEEFCVAVPGNIDWYGAEPPDALRLAEKLCRESGANGSVGLELTEADPDPRQIAERAEKLLHGDTTSAES